jgi:glycosyltransferase involved in cell wall biosynthesis
LKDRRAIFLTEESQIDRAQLRYGPIIPHLINSGWDPQILSYPKSYWARSAFGRKWRDSVFVLGAHLYSEMTLALLRAQVSALVLDLDDPIWINPRDKTSGQRPSRTRQLRFKNTLQVVDAVVCANPYLINKVGAGYPTIPRRLIPNSIRLLNNSDNLTGPIPSKKNGAVTLLWIGSQATLCYLNKLMPVLQELKTQVPGLSLKVVSDAFPEIQGALNIERIPWSPSSVEAALRDADIGLMPLDRHPWSLGKSGYKVLQYMAAGLAVVSEPQGGGAFLLPDAYPYLASSPKQWIAAIRALAEDKDLRSGWGGRLQDEVRRRFLPEIVARAWHGLGRDLLSE